MWREAAAPLALLGVMAAGAVFISDIWLAAGLASLIGTGTFVAPDPGPWLLAGLLRDGAPAVVSSAAVPEHLFYGALITVVTIEVAAVLYLAIVTSNRARPGDRRRSLLRARDLGDLTGDPAVARARRLRPAAGELNPTGHGLRLLSIEGRDVWMSWEDVALVIMGPRSNKTSAVAVPTVLAAPGLAIATSNKSDLWALTSAMRGRAGPVWTFDPQAIAHVPQTWWWDPLRSIRDVPAAERFDAAARLATHFMSSINGERKDPFFHSAGEQLLASTLLAAAINGGSMRDVTAWLQPGRRDAITVLDEHGALHEAADLEATLGGADVTTKGVMQTARTAARALSSERLLRWITPPATWREPPTGPVPVELDIWEVLAAARNGPATVYLLSKEGAGTAAPVITALVDRLLEAAEKLAEAGGGRLEPPLVAMLDEAANICPIRALPQLYSHYGSRGLVVFTILQSYSQGAGVWGEQGMAALWSAATVKLVGAGVDDHSFLQKLSGLIGDHHVERVSTSIARGGGSRQYATAREPIVPPSALRAIPRTQAVLLTPGRKAGLGLLRPWYSEREHAEITSYADAALTELRHAAARALGPDNPVNRPRIARPGEDQPRDLPAPGARNGSAPPTPDRRKETP